MMSIVRHILSVTFMSSALFMATGSTVHAGALDFLEPSKLGAQFKNIMARQRIGSDINIVNAEVFDGLSAALKYKIQSEPSYVNGFYTRLDKYTLDVNADPGDFIQGNSLPLGFAIDSQSEIIFARQFKKQGESLTALPYGPKNIPLSSEQAIRNLNPGDFVALTGKLSFVVSLSTENPIASINVAEASTHAYISGEFMIHTFRMTGNKLRVKLIALRGKGVGSTADLKLANFKVMGFKYIDRKIRNWVNLDALSIGIGSGSNNLFMLDYVFDLNNSQAAQAYDDLIQRKARFKDFTIINPIEKSASVKEEMLTDLSVVEAIAKEDHSLDPAKRRIDRVFKGTNESKSTDASFKFGISLFRFESGTTYAQNKIVHIDREEKEQKYIMDTFQASNKIKLLFGFFGDDTRITTNMLFTSDDNWGVREFVALTLGRQIKMRNVSEKDFKEIQENVKSVIPATEYAKINWKKWDFSGNNPVNGYFSHELFFHPNALRMIPTLNYETAKTRLYNFIKTHGRPKAPPVDKGPYDDAQSTTGLDRYEYDIQYLANALAKVFNPAVVSETRYQVFKDIKDHPLWQQYAAGFMISLIPADQIPSLIAYEMTFSAKDVDAISFRFGNFDQEELYKSLMYIQRVITDRSFDLRLFTDKSGEFRLR